MVFKPGNNMNPAGRPRGPNARVRLIDIQRGLAKLSHQMEDFEETLSTFVSGGGTGRVDNESRENRRENRREED